MRLLDSGVARYTFSNHDSTDGKPQYRLQGQKAVRKIISAKALWNGQSNSYLYLGHCRGGFNTGRVYVILVHFSPCHLTKNLQPKCVSTTGVPAPMSREKMKQRFEIPGARR